MEGRFHARITKNLQRKETSQELAAIKRVDWMEVVRDPTFADYASGDLPINSRKWLDADFVSYLFSFCFIYIPFILTCVCLLIDIVVIDRYTCR